MRPHKPPTLHELKLMLISADNTDLLGTLAHLESWGIQPTVCANSVRAFSELMSAQAAGVPYQVVLVETGHSELEASQLAVSLRSEPCLQSLYLVGITSQLSPQKSEQLLNSGYSKLLTTPLNKTRLFNTLHFADQADTLCEGVSRLADHLDGSLATQRLEILLACSDSAQAKRLQQMLVQLNHHCFTVSDGDQALDALDNHSFDLAIMHADLEQVSGMEVIRLYRFTRLNQSWVPFVLVFDNPTTQIIRECEESEVDEYLAIPQDCKNLQRAIANACRNPLGEQPSIAEYTPPAGNKERNHLRLTLDLEKLAELTSLAGDESFLGRLVSQFSGEINRLLEEMEQEGAPLELQRIHEYGHQLKDNAGNLGALGLYRLGVKLTALKAEDLPQEFEHLVAEIRVLQAHTIGSLLEHLGIAPNQASRKH